MIPRSRHPSKPSDLLSLSSHATNTIFQDMDETSSAPPPSSACVRAVLQRISDLDSRSPVPTQDYPPISSIPRTSPERLQRATPKQCPDEHIPTSSPEANDYLYDHTASTPTVLYLAYGSNLSAQIFLGKRGIRPISTVNVLAPSLRLTFDLPGYPYEDPCFANTAPRKVPKVPKVPDHPTLPPGLDPPQYLFPPSRSPSGGLIGDRVGQGLAGSNNVPTSNAYGDPVWDRGLVGVVYEVTPEDYATIVRTEGGGTLYQNVLCPCIPIPQNVGVPEKPPFPELPRPFLAHTLYAPRIPTKPGDGDGNEAGNGDDDDGDGDDGDDKGPLDKLKDWWREKLLQPLRPDPEYAQPSARYLGLIVEGAAEHGLPDDYQNWLARLQPYTITTRRQAIGQFLFLGVMKPLISIFLALSSWLADDRGKIPAWFALIMETVIHLVWVAYDRVFKPVFGDGERTEDEEEKRRRRGSRRVLRKKRRVVGDDEEKLGLLRL